MADPVNLIVPADERFRNLAPEVGGRYVVAAGGSESDASALVGALTEAIGALTAGTLLRERYDSFVKLQLEISYLREAEKRAGWQDKRKGDRVAHRVFNKQG